mgnify:CR=1 FL=1
MENNVFKLFEGIEKFAKTKLLYRKIYNMLKVYMNRKRGRCLEEF